MKISTLLVTMLLAGQTVLANEGEFKTKIPFFGMVCEGDKATINIVPMEEGKFTLMSIRVFTSAFLA